MTQRGRRSLPIPLCDVLEGQRNEEHEDVLWRRVERARCHAHVDLKSTNTASALPVPVSSVLVDQENLSAVRLRHHRLLRARRARKPERRYGRLLLATGALLAVLGFALVRPFGLTLSPSAPSSPQLNAKLDPLTLSDGSLPATLEAEEKSIEVVLSDASSIRLAPHSRLVSLASTDSRLDLLLEEGKAHFDVTPNGPRRWTIEAGIARIEVVGTVFDVSRQHNEVNVSVSRGAVLVRSASLPHGVARLVAGNTLKLEPQKPEPVPPAAVAPEATLEDAGSLAHRAKTEDAPTQAAQAQRSKARPLALPADVPQWQTAYHEGRYDAAYHMLGEAEFVRLVRATTRAEELLKLADLARLSGHVQESVLPLKRVLDDFNHSSHAPVSAFTLGRIYLDQLRDAKAAVHAFERAIALNPPLALLEDCHARLVRAYAVSGDSEQAKQAASRYRALFPSGRHLRDLARYTSDE